VKPGLSKKFHFPWSVPFQVTAKLSDLNCELLGNYGRKFVVDVNRMKLCNGNVKQEAKPVPKHRRLPKFKGDELSGDTAETESIQAGIAFYPLVVETPPQ
jgi:hypothetical protein